MQKSAKLALIAVIVVVLGGGAGFWYFVLRDTAPPRVELDLTGGTAGGATPGSGGTGTTPGSPTGTWTVKADPSNVAGYRIDEVFAGETITKEAAGRTSKVEGSLTINGSVVESAEFTVDMTSVTSDRPTRDGFMRSNGLETDTFKTATFTLTEAVTLPSVPEIGKEFDVKAKGDLTVHGQTKPVELSLKAGWTGEQIRAIGEAPIVLADFGITKLTLGPATIAERGILEVSLIFEK